MLLGCSGPPNACTSRAQRRGGGEHARLLDVLGDLVEPPVARDVQVDVAEVDRRRDVQVTRTGQILRLV
jgi:hypothetical protein